VTEPEGELPPAALVRFGHELASRLGVAAECPVLPATTLFDDWGLDSFQAFQMLIIIEAMADVVLPPPTLPSLFTVQDAYDYYRALLTPDPTG